MPDTIDRSNDVIIERIANLKEFFKEEFEKNSEEHISIKEIVASNEKRIRKLEDWKLVFVAKYSVYSAIALFLGSLVATLGMSLIKGMIVN